MSKTRKYRNFGVRRENNLSDVKDPKTSLENLLNNLPEVIEGKTFLSEDLDAIRGLFTTNINSSNFRQLVGAAPIFDFTNTNGETQSDLIKPIVRLSDRFLEYRSITGSPGQFGSGDGPTAYFIESTNLTYPIDKGDTIDSIIVNGYKNANTKKDEEFWAFGEFYFENKIENSFSNNFGGVLWEGYLHLTPGISSHILSYKSSGLIQIEYDPLDDGNWTVLKSIYNTARTVEVIDNGVTPDGEASFITISLDDAKYVQAGDTLVSYGARVNDINIGMLTATLLLSELLDTPPTAGQSINLLTTIANSGFNKFNFNTPIILSNNFIDPRDPVWVKVRILLWFPDLGDSYVPVNRYCVFDYPNENAWLGYFQWSKQKPDDAPEDLQVKNIIQNTINAEQNSLGISGLNPLGSGYKDLRSTEFIQSIYTPKSLFTDNVISEDDSVAAKYFLINGNQDGTILNFDPEQFDERIENGNILLPENILNFTEFYKDLKIVNLLERTIGGNSSLTYSINKTIPEIISDETVAIVNHLGLVDYFIASSVDDVVTIDTISGDSSKLFENLMCVTMSTTVDQFVRIVEIISPTQFRTSENLNLSNEYILIYHSSGFVDRSKVNFCEGVIGKKLSSTVFQGATELTLENVTGIAVDDWIQFDGSIPVESKVIDITGNIVTISNPLSAQIDIESIIVIVPGEQPYINKESCILPLDVSPPFVGIDTGLSTNGRNIKSSFIPSIGEFNVIAIGLESEGTSTVDPVDNFEYNRKIKISKIIDPVTSQVTQFSILAKKV